MSFGRHGRGRGRGRGRGFGGSERAGKKEPYILFPEDVTLPSLPNVDTMLNEDKRQITQKYRLERFWLGSCYHLEQVIGSKSGKRSKADKEKEWEGVEIERYSDRFIKKKAEAKREELESYLKLTATSFPTELIQGQKQKQPSNKKLRWDGNPADKKLDEFEELEKNFKQDGKETKKEENDEEEPEGNEEKEESSDDGDYAQNIDFDDDEDDLNMEEEQDEDYYE